MIWCYQLGSSLRLPLSGENSPEVTLFNLGTPTLRSLASSLEMNPEPQAVLSRSSRDQRMKYIAEYSHQESHGATTAQPVLFPFSGREEYRFVCKTPHSLCLHTVSWQPFHLPTCFSLYSLLWLSLQLYWPDAASEHPIREHLGTQCDNSVPSMYTSYFYCCYGGKERGGKEGGMEGGRKGWKERRERGEGLILAHSLRIPSWLLRLAGGSMRQLSLWFRNHEAERNKSWYAGCFRLFSQTRTTAHGVVSASSRMSLPNLNSIEKFRDRHSHKFFFSMVILNPMNCQSRLTSTPWKPTAALPGPGWGLCLETPQLLHSCSFF